jgi:hypothetical protein
MRAAAVPAELGKSRVGRWSAGEAQPLTFEGRASSQDARLADRKASQRVRVAHAPEAPTRRSIPFREGKKGRRTHADQKTGPAELAQPNDQSWRRNSDGNIFSIFSAELNCQPNEPSSDPSA